MIRAAKAHQQYEKRTGQSDANWPAWYAEYMVREQLGEELLQYTFIKVARASSAARPWTSRLRG